MQKGNKNKTPKQITWWFVDYITPIFKIQLKKQ